ncbi:MAG: hypothetical protein JOY73_04475 [Actinobacteria bacterium]|nr:hypothetical protein [Actinomycetota bacterium]
MPRTRVLVVVSVAAGAAAMLLAGCGGGPAAPGIASVAGGTTSTSTTQNDSGQQPLGGGPTPGGSFRLAMKVGTVDGEKFSECMRKNGVTNFPDPNGQGVITIDSGTGIDPGSPAFRSAQKTCRKLLPNGGQPTPAQQAQQQKQMLEFSVCMRTHGIKDFPDPSDGGLRIRVQPGTSLDPNSPQFQSAMKACQKYGPKGLGPGG